ncbi:MAG: DMT family transporter [Rhizobiaceae bacterium]
MKRSSLFAILLALGMVWGGTIPLTKIVVSTGHHPIGLLFWQSIVAVLIVGCIIIYRRSQIDFDKRHLVFFTMIAFSGTLLPNSVSYYSAYHLPASVLALTIALVPMFSLLVALVFKIEKFNIVRLGGVLLGAAAIALITLPENSLPDPTKAIFVLILLLAPLCYAVEGNYLAVQQPKGTGPFATLFGASLIGILVTTPLALTTGTFINPLNTFGAPELALVASTLLHVVAYSGYIWMVDKAGAVFSSQVAYVVTPAGVILSMIFLGENPSPYLWFALLILLVALTLVRPSEVEK